MFHTFEALRYRVAVVLCVVIPLLSAGNALAATKLYRNVSGLPLPANGDILGGPVAIDGHTAITGSEHGAYVTETNGFGWFAVATLALDGLRPLAAGISGDTAVVATGAGVPPCLDCGPRVYVFERNKGGPNAWGRVKLLFVNVGSQQVVAANSIAISGDTVVVGMQGAFNDRSGVRGQAWVYERNLYAPNSWLVAAVLQPKEGSGPSRWGGSVSVSNETMVIGGVEAAPTVTCPSCWSGLVDVFERDRGGPYNWGLSGTLPSTLPAAGQAHFVNVAIDGDTVVATREPDFSDDETHATAVQIFGRQSGSDAWNVVANLDPIAGQSGAIALSGDRLAVATQTTVPNPVWIYARNQGGPDAWGLADGLAITGQTFNFGNSPGRLSMSGPSVLVADSFYEFGGARTGAAFVFVSDLDGDGVTDDGDQCPQDPLNNVVAGCRRSTADSSLMDNVVTMSGMTTALKKGDFLITVTFTNTSNGAIDNPFFIVSELSGGNVLKNGDGGAYGVGATLSPDVGDGLLFPGESTRVTLVIGLASRQPFRFFVNVRGTFPP